MTIEELKQIFEKYKMPISNPFFFELANALEKEPILDKIRTEIEQNIDKEKLSFGGQFDSGLNLAIKIIDKYKAKSKETA